MTLKQRESLQLETMAGRMKEESNNAENRASKEIEKKQLTLTGSSTESSLYFDSGGGMRSVCTMPVTEQFGWPGTTVSSKRAGEKTKV